MFVFSPGGFVRGVSVRGAGREYQEKLFSQWDFASVSQEWVMPYFESGSRDSNVGGGSLESSKRVRKSVSWESGMEIVKGVGWARAPGGTALYWLAILNVLGSNLESFQVRLWGSDLEDWHRIKKTIAT